MNQDEKFISVSKLITVLLSKADAEVSTYEDLESTECKRNDWHRGKEAAFNELLEELNKIS